MQNKRYIVFDIETTGLNPLDSRITCICARTKDSEAVYQGCHTNEKGLISDFIKWLRKENDGLLISANGKEFDLTFIFMRAFIKGLSFRNMKFILKFEHFDIIKDITDKKISLNNLARLYGFKLKSGDGVNAIKLFEDIKLEELMEYCMNDVKLTEQVYLKYLETNK